MRKKQEGPSFISVTIFLVVTMIVVFFLVFFPKIKGYSIRHQNVKLNPTLLQRIKEHDERMEKRYQIIRREQQEIDRRLGIPPPFRCPPLILKNNDGIEVIIDNYYCVPGTREKFRNRFLLI